MTRATSRRRPRTTSRAPASPTPRTSVPRPSSTSSTRPASTRTSTRATTTSTRSKVCGTPGREKELDGTPNLGYKIRYKEGYFPVPPMDQYQDLRSEMLLTLEKVGIEIEVQHHEVGTAGQAEIDMRFDTLTTMADKLMLYKYVVKNVAHGRRQVGHVHAEAPLPGQRLGHARAPVALEGRRAALLRREGLRRSVRPRRAGTSAVCSSTRRRCSRSPTRR